MKIAGLVRSSLIDYPGKIVAIVFTQGCNFACGFCHNPELVTGSGGGSEIAEGKLFEFLSDRVGKLDGVVVTGGEPTIRLDLPDFLCRIKKLGFKVKLDTNGSNPTMLKKMLDDNLIDYVAMDVKGTWNQYREISGFFDTDKIKKSIKLIIDSGVDHEFRTTTLPRLHKISDFEEIGEMVRGAQTFTVQGFRPGKTLEPAFSTEKPLTASELKGIEDVIKKYVGRVIIHENSPK